MAEEVGRDQLARTRSMSSPLNSETTKGSNWRFSRQRTQGWVLFAESCRRNGSAKSQNKSLQSQSLWRTLLRKKLKFPPFNKTEHTLMIGFIGRSVLTW